MLSCMLNDLPEDILGNIFHFCLADTCIKSSKASTILRKMSFTELESRLIMKICYQNIQILDIYKTPEQHPNFVRNCKRVLFTKHHVPYLEKVYMKNPHISNVHIEHFFPSKCTTRHVVKKPDGIRIDYDNNKVVMVRLCTNGLTVCVRYQNRWNQ